MLTLPSGLFCDAPSLWLPALLCRCGRVCPMDAKLCREGATSSIIGDQESASSSIIGDRENASSSIIGDLANIKGKLLL